MITDCIQITRAEYLGEHRIRLEFDDGAETTVDFLPFLSGSRHPDIRAFLDLAKFRSFRLQHGNLMWGDFDLCFPVSDLRANTLQPIRRVDAAA